MNLEKCPLCGMKYDSEQNMKGRSGASGPCSRSRNAAQGEYVACYCGYYDVPFSLNARIVTLGCDETREKLYNLITEHLLQAKYWTEDGEKREWKFDYYDRYEGPVRKPSEYVNLANGLKTYPDQVMDKAHRALRNLSLRYPHYGDAICLSWREERAIFEHETNNSHSFGMLQILEELGYLRDPRHDDVYSITASGWQKIEELKKKEQVVRQAFIAMIFREEGYPIREAFRQAIEDMGYHAVILDEKEHNNQIVPEIFYEIKRSKFVVVDVTYPSYGAYYEAGYAEALGREVIVCCRETEFKDPEKGPHFDIAQKPIIAWKDEKDLVERLKRRIEATVT